METDELPFTQELFRSPSSTPSRRAKRLWVVAAIVFAAAVPGALAVQGGIHHDQNAATRNTVSTVIAGGQAFDGLILHGDRSTEDPGTFRPPDSADRAAVPDGASASADQVAQGGSGD